MTQLAQPPRVIRELLSPEGTREFKITEQQFYGLISGWTHLEVMGKPISEMVYDQCIHTPASTPTPEQTAAIRNATLENIIEQLSDLNHYSCEEYEEASLSDNEREMRIHLEYENRLWGIIKSLRITEAQK